MTSAPTVAFGETLRLYPFTASDITPQYIEWLNDPQVVRFSNQRFCTHDARTCAAYLESFSGTDNLFLAVRLAKHDVMIGTMTAYVARHHGTADMGILIGDRSVWGRGVGLEAWNVLMSHLLESESLRKITGGAVRGNVSMIRIMERSGMKLEATKVQQEIIEGAPQDVLYFAKFR